MNKTQKIESVMEVVRILVGLLIAYGVALLTLLLISDEPGFIVAIDKVHDVMIDLILILHLK